MKPPREYQKTNCTIKVFGTDDDLRALVDLLDRAQITFKCNGLFMSVTGDFFNRPSEDGPEQGPWQGPEHDEDVASIDDACQAERNTG